ncbi:MAG: transporter substrate-binding domain-containing protein, partial [Spirochaetaceae bacterium]|nr:transporter substrate-binding domain-containing protein [Spirochaetaceae bacterium]
VARGMADALIQINPTEARKRIFDFSDPLLESHFSIFIRKSMVGVSALSSLNGLRVGVEAGGLPRQLLENDPGVQLAIIPDFLHGFKNLRDGELDAVVVDNRVGTFILAENRIAGITSVGDPIAASYSAFAVKKGDTELLDSINEALRAIKSDGTYQKIIDGWKPKETVYQTREQLAQTAYRSAVLLLAVVFSIAVIWAMTLRRSLARRKAAEGRLRDQYSTISSIINSARALIFSLDRSYRYTCFNREHATVMKAMYGKDIELGRSLLDYMTVPEDREIANRNLDRALAGEELVEESYSGEEILSRRFFRISHSPVKSEKGDIIGVAVLAQDISERRHAEETLRRQNRKLQAISACNQILMRAEEERSLLDDICGIVCDTAGYRLAWVGYPEDDDEKSIRPVAWYGAEDGYLSQSRLTWAEGERERDPCAAAIRQGKTVCIQDLDRDPLASPWREESLKRGFRACIALPLKDERGGVFGVLNIYSVEPEAFTPEETRLLDELSGDLAFGIKFLRARIARRRMDEDLQRLNARFSLAADAAGLGVWDWDLRKDELVWDDRMYALYGVKREDFGGAYDAWLKGVHPDDRARSDETSRRARSGDAEYDTEFRVVWPDGSVHVLKAYARITRDSEGRALRMTGANFDITELKRRGEELRSLNEGLEERVKIRTAELQESNLELDKMNKLFIGRELRMRELKIRIAELEGVSVGKEESNE